MDKKIAGLLGAVAGLATMSAAQAATQPAPNRSEALQSSSYADLLAPIPNAAALLKADEAARAQQPPVQLAQYYYPPPYVYYHHHHHHHHHAYWRRYSHHHHHHHHVRGYVAIPGVGGVVIR